MKIDKKAINYYNSFFDVSKELNQKQFYDFNMAIFKVLFFEVHIDSIEFKDTILIILWKSIRHSLCASLKGYCDKTKVPYDDIFDPLSNPLNNPLSNPLGNNIKNKYNEEEKEKEKEKGERVHLVDDDENILFLEYLTLRKKMKLSNSETVIKRLLNKLDKFYKNGHSKIDVISNAINSSWKDFYEPSQNTAKSFKQQDSEKTDLAINAFLNARDNGFDLRNVANSEIQDIEVIGYE